ncbi:MAG: aldose 1-epimerase [Pseudomonadota bacterium]
MITLRSGDMALSLAPEIGGSVASLVWRGQNLLRTAPTQSDAIDPRDMAAFPMVPFVGRVPNGVFVWNGNSIRLPANMPPEPHAIHGFGWQTEWETTHVSANAITLCHEHSTGAWPWEYVATQHFQVDPNRLQITLALWNQSTETMPAGLGWHPYFPKAGALLHMQTEEEWIPASSYAPTKAIAVHAERDFSKSRILRGLDIDHVFSISAPEINLSWPTYELQLNSASPISFATVYAPSEADFFCVEPITHVPGALNGSVPLSNTGLRLIEPNSKLELKLQLSVRSLSD